ncbi:MAG TPA: hypothetical protein VH328_04420, partial [Burkholderiaceae bacterium]|nr:hypothetical protein [Burkholderiaceae bacterium]
VDKRGHQGVVVEAEGLFWDLLAVVFSRKGALALLVCAVPIATGSAGNLWGAVADDWHATADTVALVNGALFGIVAPLGSIAGGWICDRFDRTSSYCLFAFVQLLIATALAYSPRTSPHFVLWTTLYAVTQGLDIAAFSALVLEVIGRTSAATKSSLLASLIAQPVAFMTYLEGVAHQSWGTQGMLLTEAAVAMAGLATYLAIMVLTRPRRSAAPLARAPG